MSDMKIIKIRVSMLKDLMDKDYDILAIEIDDESLKTKLLNNLVLKEIYERFLRENKPIILIPPEQCPQNIVCEQCLELKSAIKKLRRYIKRKYEKRPLYILFLFGLAKECKKYSR